MALLTAADLGRPEHRRGAVDTLPSPSQDDPRAWAREMGHRWARWFRRLGVPPDGNVVEIGPGFAPKIGIGLAAVEFHGTVLLVEPNDAARRAARNQYRVLVPDAEVLTSAVPLPGAVRLPVGRVDLVAANHVLDDLVLNACLPPADAAAVFAGMHAGSACSRQFIEAWQRIRASPGLVDDALERAVDDLAIFVTRARPARLVVNEYPSWRHIRGELPFIHDVGLRAIRRLELRLAADYRSTVRSCPAGHSISWLISSRPGPAGRNDR